MALIKDNKCNYLSNLLPWQLSNEFAWKQGREAIRLPRMPLLSRLRHNVACIGPNQKNQPNLDLFLVRRYNIFHFPIVVSYLCIGQTKRTNLIWFCIWFGDTTYLYWSQPCKLATHCVPKWKCTYNEMQTRFRQILVLS